MESVADCRILIGHILEFEYGKWNPVHKNHNVRSAVDLVFDDCKLVYGSPIIVVRLVKVEDFHLVVNDPAFRSALDVYSIRQELVKPPIALFQIRTCNA